MAGAANVIALAFSLAAALTSDGLAQSFPTRAITIIVPQAAGGGTDIISRIVGQQLSSQLGVAVVIENRTGAGTVVGTEAAAKASPDGYTLLAGFNANMTVNPSLFANLKYDPLRDFTPVGMLAQYPLVLVVSNTFAARSVKELIDMAKERPGQINFGSGGNGTGQHLSGELLKLLAGIDLTHVPYRGSGPAYTDVIAGRTPVMFDSIPSALGHIRGGSVRPLAVTSRQRSPLFPELPTMAETAAPDYENGVWFGLWAPAGTPEAVVDKLNADVEAAIRTPSVKDKIVSDGGTPMHIPLHEISSMLRREIAKWADVIKRANIAAQ